MTMPHRCTHTRGFTLLEMTVVLALVVLMSLVIAESLRFGGRAYAQVIDVNEANWKVFVAQRFLRTILESAYPFEPDRVGGAAYGLEGTATRLLVSSPGSRSAGINRYDMMVAADGNHRGRRNLLVKWHVDRDGRADANLVPEQEVLVKNIARVEWNYAAGSCGEPIAWQETWQGRRELPALIRARVIFPANDPRRWPDLIVAPRLTDDAIAWSYRPDVAGQRCGSSP